MFLYQIFNIIIRLGEKMSKISILLSSYNHEEYIAESIESILRQTFNDFELVIVDDHSDDNSWEVIKKYNDPRIKAKRLEKNTNCAYVWPTLMSLESEYIAVAHCDDKWREDKLEKQMPLEISEKIIMKHL